MIITEFLAGLSLTSKIVAGVSAVAVTGAAAGAAGVLPDQSEADLDTGTEIAVEAEVSGDAEVPGREDGSVGPAPSASDVAHEAAEFGTSVAEDARDGGVDGSTVAGDAQAQGEARAEAGAETGAEASAEAGVPDEAHEDAPAVPSDPTEAGAEATAELEAEVEVETGPDTEIEAGAEATGEAGVGIGASDQGSED